jgi:hypothetical protein
MIDPPPSLCFDDGYDVAGMIFDPESGLSKAAGLMANALRLDDHPRMSIYKEYGKRQLKFYRRTPSVAERERLMGFPPNYVSEPREYLVFRLFLLPFRNMRCLIWHFALPSEKVVQVPGLWRLCSRVCRDQPTLGRLSGRRVSWVCRGFSWLSWALATI